MGLPAAHPHHVADRPGADGGERLQRLGRVHEVLEVAAEHPAGSTRSTIRLASRPCGPAASCTARPCPPRPLRRSPLVHVVGQADDDGVDVRMVDGVVHVGRGVRHAPALLERRAPLHGPRVHDLDPVAAAPAVQRHRVEVADQPGAEHGDAVSVHVLDSSTARFRLGGAGDAEASGGELGGRGSRAPRPSRSSGSSGVGQRADRLVQRIHGDEALGSGVEPGEIVDLASGGTAATSAPISRAAVALARSPLIRPTVPSPRIVPVPAIVRAGGEVTARSRRRTTRGRPSARAMRPRRGGGTTTRAACGRAGRRRPRRAGGTSGRGGNVAGPRPRELDGLVDGRDERVAGEVTSACSDGGGRSAADR